MNDSLEQMILDAVSAPGVTQQIGNALIAGDMPEIGFIVQRAVKAARAEHAEVERERAEQVRDALDAKFGYPLAALAALTIRGKA